MELANLTTILPALAAEPASIIYMVSGAVGLLFARRRTLGQFLKFRLLPGARPLCKRGRNRP